MSVDIKTIEYAAELSRLELSAEEKEAYAHQLSDILDYVEKINSLDTSSVEPTDHVLDNFNVLRKDEVKEGFSYDELAANAPRFEDGHFIVPKIIG